MTNSRGEVVETKQVMALCRCGASKTKPFCDGTHASIGFNDARAADRTPDWLDAYAGSQLTVFDNRGVCSHAGHCTSGLSEVWRMSTEPWIDPDGAPTGDIVRVIRQCPSGALAWEKDGTRHDDFGGDPEVRISRDGPYRVRGGIVLEGVEFGEGASREHFTLCRCGRSRNKPFCDGSHWYAGFKDDEALTISWANAAAPDDEPAWVRVGRADAFAKNRVNSVHVGTRVVALISTEKGWRAVDGRCSHQGGPLTEGILCDGALRCPWHGYDFDLKTGKGIGNDGIVRTFDVREVDGLVEIAAAVPTRSTWTVGHVVAETLVEWGVDTVFGMVGHSNLGMAEGIRVQEERGRLRYVGIRHEGAASFACSGYAKVSGRPAARLAIAGPGSTNLLTGLWDAKVDRVPVLALAGQVNTQVMGPGAFQEIDLSSAFEAVSRFRQTVLPGSRHAELVSLALKTAIVE